VAIRKTQVKLNLRTAEAKEEVRTATFAAVQETFEIDIKAAAKEGSPVLTGTNKRSIDTEVTQIPSGVQAKLFTQSGYGGYLEIGTRNMSARPYLQPAFDEGVSNIAEKVKENLNGS
jgi:HK97 gp10 family phage protein